MFRKPILCALLKLCALIVCLVYAYTQNSADMTFCVISALAFCCALAVELMFSTFIINPLPVVIINAGIIIAASVLGHVFFLPLITAACAHILFIIIHGKYLYAITVTAFLLIFVVIYPPPVILVFAAVFSALFLYLLEFEKKLSLTEDDNYSLKERLAELEKKLSDNKRLVKSLKYSAALEERNRLAAKLHDNVGHGISGSIIMLEAAMLTLDKKPDKAKESIQASISNLRKGVDDIRAALREERPVRSTMGLTEIQNEVDTFALSFGTKTEFKYSGQLELISPEIWVCIYNNLKEAMTNVLKHSTGDCFYVTIEVKNKIIKAEFKNNGKLLDAIKKGMGLEAIEERTIKCGGRCYFSSGENGFSISTIFVI